MVYETSVCSIRTPASSRVRVPHAYQVAVQGDDVLVPIGPVPQSLVDHTLDTAVYRIGDGQPASLQPGTELHATARQRACVVDAQRQCVLDGLQVGHVRAFADTRDFVQEVRFIFPATGVPQIHVELVPGRGELTLPIEADVGEACILLLPPEPKTLSIAGCSQDEGHLRTIRVRFEVVNPRDRECVGASDDEVGAQSDDVVGLLAILGDLRLDDATVVVVASRELVVRKIILKEKLPLDEAADSLGIVVQAQARDDLLVVGIAAELGRQIGARF